LAGCEASHFATDDTGCIRRYVGGDRKSIGFYELNPQLPRLLRHALERRTATSKQPLAKHVPLLAGMGFDQIIYLALTTSNTAIQREDELVGKNGMEHLRVAVDSPKPSLRNFELFAAILNNSGDRKSFIHCQVNYRASTFSFLYWVTYLGVPVDEAKRDLDKVWGPDPV
jgi:hypothetical protein